MADVKWIKIVTDMFDNRKIRQIETLPEGDGIIVIWFKLLCLAGNINDNGMVYFTEELPYTEQMLSTQFGRPLPLIQLALRTFESFGMIDVIDDIIYLSNWERYQNVEGMEKIREQTRKRVANYRERQKVLGCNATVTQCNATDKNKKENKKENKNNKPTLEEVTEYIKDKGYNVDPKQFFEYYDASDWHDKDGKPVKNWKQRVISWNGRAEKKPKDNKFHNFEERETNLDNDVMDSFNKLFKE